MKQISLIILIVILFSCGNSELKKEIISTYPDGTVLKEIYYKWEEDTKVVLKEIRYYTTGQKQQEGEFLNKEKTGKWKFWNDDGSLWSEGEYLNGKRNGKGTVWHKDGTKHYESNWKDGKPNGTWTFYKKGKKEQIVEYNMGEIIKKEIIK